MRYEELLLQSRETKNKSICTFVSLITFCFYIAYLIFKNKILQYSLCGTDCN